MKRYSRRDLVKQLRDVKKSGDYIIVAGSGSGISAKTIEQGGADMLMVFNSGYYRMHGIGSLSGWMPLGNANDVAFDLGTQHVLPIVKEAPVICSVFCQDVTKSIDLHLDKIKANGFAGVNNFPTMGMVDGQFRQQLELTGFGFDKEVEMIELANEKDIFSIVYVFNEEEAIKMAKAGADCIVVHVGLTVGGTIGTTKAMTIEESADVVKRAIAAGSKVNKDVLWLAHGGPLATPNDFKEFLKYLPSIDGFVGASSMERIPTEEAIIATVKEFKGIK